MTEYARAKSVSFVSDPSEVDLNRVGKTSLTLKHGSREENVILTIQDTTAPKAEIPGTCEVPVNDIPSAGELVSNVQDLSETKVYYRQVPYLSEDYQDVTVTIVVEDAWGNAIEQECAISFQWMLKEYALELGEELTKEALLLRPEKDADALDQAALDQINEAGVGEYTLTSVLGSNERTCMVKVQDTTGPALELNEVQRRVGKSVKLDDFVKSVTDISEIREVRLMTEVDTSVDGTYTVTIEAEDIYGNITTGETTLWVTHDTVKPVISGSLGTMTVEKHSSPDFLSGVSAKDDQDGVCKVTVDTSKLDLDTAGTYYITYKATDSSGNVGTAKRKVVVSHDAEDTKALVKQIASQLSNDPEKIRDYVRKKISYNTNWGGSDPVWYGFTNKVGNCYVHAMCLKAIFDEKGIESRLIWVTNKTHYWLIVKINGGWKHIDATPGTRHTKYSLMNDDQRYETLSGRDWDRSQWPACN